MLALRFQNACVFIRSSFVLQLLVYQVLCKLFPPLDSKASETMTLEKRCFEDLKSYLAKNSDCMRYDISNVLFIFFPLQYAVSPCEYFILSVFVESGNSKSL